MKLAVKPLYSQLNGGVGNCPLGCIGSCRVREKTPYLQPPPGYTCPLYLHQAQTYAAVVTGTADIVFNKSATGGGKTLGANLPSLLDPNFRMMGLYPTIELVEDQTQQLINYHQWFGLDPEARIERLFGEELSRRVQAEASSKFEELRQAIYHKPVILTNPDIFHLITHYQYRHPAYAEATLPLILAEYPDLWTVDEFHIFGPHQEAAVLNSLTLIRRSQQQPRRFLFTSATPKADFIEMLQQSEFTVTEITGVYASEETPGYRQILQSINLEFVQLADGSAEAWLANTAPIINGILAAESQGRGLIILNSIAAVSRVVQMLAKLLPDVLVREISGRVDRASRKTLQAELANSPQPVLIIATSAADVGVDFKIHLLIAESSDSATVVQRLGRLGRHPGFSTYHAFVLISQRSPWVMARLQESLPTEALITREELQNGILAAFETPNVFGEYRKHWGALQAQGMLAAICRENAAVSKELQERMTTDLTRVYGEKLASARKQWYAIGNKDIGKATQTELLRFRGGTAIQAAVWDKTQGKPRFYTYDLLRLLPHTQVEICSRDEFLAAASNAGYGSENFPEKYIQVYLQVIEWVNQRFDITLKTNRDTEELTTCQLSLLSHLTIVGHPQGEVSRCLKGRKILAFLVPVNRNQPSSHWQVSYKLHLSPLFGLYRLTDAAAQAYACAFNQDALLLEALKYRLGQFCRRETKSLIF
ncbi:MAG: hypothetical protein Fur0025_15730 [Oscillatoriaceae cyanobacterium]